MARPLEDDAPLPEELPRRSSTRNIVILVVVLAGAAVFVTQILPLLIVLWPRSQKPAQRLEDMNDLRVMAGILISEGQPLAPDGRIDVYAVLRRVSNDTKQILDICSSSRSGKGPTWEEIEAGDYTNFPYQRYKGALDRKSFVRVPVVWDRKSSDGWGARSGGSGEGRLAAFSDGSSMFEEEAAFRKFFEANPGQE